MTPKVNPLITSLYSGMISKEEFIREYFKDIISSNEYVLDQIEKGITNKNNIAIEEAIVILYAGTFSINLFSEKLCELLLYPWHTKQEDIAMLLKEIADPNTVNCLYNAAELRFDHLDYDDTYQFARKCIKALSAIGNENAIEKLKILANSTTIEIADYAVKELHYKGLL